MKWLGVLVLVGGCMSPVMTFGEGKSAKQAQHDTLTDLLPARLAMEPAWRGPVKDAKIRVHADDAHRAQNRSWRENFGETLEYVNAVVGPKFGVRLVAEYREWNHHAPGNTLESELRELQDHDAGGDVLAVVGLTSSLSLVSATFEQLGFASVPGRHMMLRGYADLEERAAFSRAFPDLSADERENALAARRQHKLAALLLHELGHNLGVGHESTEDTLMNAHYSAKAAAFSGSAHATMQHALDQRLGRAEPDAAPQVQAAAAQKKVHPKMFVRLVADGVLVDGRPTEDGSLNMVFSSRAALDPETEVVIEKERFVPTERVLKVVDRAKAMGLTRVTFK